MSNRDRAGIFTAGAKLGLSALRYNLLTRRHEHDSPANRQQYVYDFEDERTFADLIGQLPPDAAKLFETVVTRSAGDMDEISAGCGVGYFALVLFAGKGLNRNIVGGPATLTEGISVALGDRVQLGAAVQEIVHRPSSVVVRYTQHGVDHEIEARAAVLATTAALRAAADEALLRGEPLAVLRITGGVDQPHDDPTLREELGRALAGYATLEWDVHSTPEGTDPAEAILDLADELDASLLVMGSRRRRPIGKLILGSTVQKVLLESMIPVLVVKAP
ncbi:MAG: universal stress protein [Tetrasphaera sp.]